MEHLFSVVVVLKLLVVCVVAQSPCPDVFEYQNNGGQLFGLIKLRPTGPVSSVIIKANFTIATRLASSYVGQLEPLDFQHGIQQYNQGSTLLYRVHFPVTSPLPRLTSLVVNDRTICYGPGDIPGPVQYVSTISLRHMLYLRGGQNNVIPFDQINQINQVKPSPAFSSTGDTQLINFSDGSGFQTFIVDKNGGDTIRPGQQGQNFNIHYTDQGKVTQRPTVSFYPQQQPDYNRYPRPEQPTDYNPPRPEQPPPDYNPYTTLRPEQPPPDYNPYTTLRPEQPPPDYNPYATKRPVQAPAPSIPLNPPPNRGQGTDFSRVECGTVVGGNERQPLVHHGQAYERGEWPWLVALYRRNQGGLAFSCGGTLITNRHVVSAAHCLVMKASVTSIKDIVVKVGVYNLEDWGDDLSVTRTLESATIHEAYNTTNLANDIVVFTFDKAVEYSANVRPACLWDGVTDLNRVVGASGVVAGWGSTELGPGGQGLPRMARIPIVSTATCRASLPDFHKLTSDTTLCAGDRNGIGPCLGDSGGGLYILDSGRWRLRGVVSVSLRSDIGTSTCDLRQYVVFTDAAKYLQWIKKIVQSSQI